MRTPIAAILIGGLTLATGCVNRVPQDCDGLCSEVNYQRTGGIVGADDEVRIQTDGEITVTGNLLGDGQGQLTEQQQNQLAELFSAWHALPDPVSNPNIADGFNYDIAYDDRSIAWKDGDDNINPVLSDIRERIEDLAEDVVANNGRDTLN